MPLHRAVTAIASLILTTAALCTADQTLSLDLATATRTFEGVGAVSGGGATSVLLKDYPPAQRDQVLDLLFKPNFGAAMQTLYVEIGGDGNSTQGSEPTHMRSRTDENYSRGYEWWLMTAAKQRNPALTLDACAWGCPGWIGDGNFWSQDMADYNVKWIKGLKANYGLDLDAVGCRNERGVVTWWAKIFRKTLDANGLQSVRLHGFDSPGNTTMWDWTKDLDTDKELADSVNVLSNHTLTLAKPDPKLEALATRLAKPIWNTEEHPYNGDGRDYKDDYETALGVLHLFNDNFISHKATKVVNWYLVGSTYGIEPYADQPPAMIAQTPWSGHYRIKPELWSYAHYGQFTHIGWKYIESGCTALAGGGTVVALKSDGNDYSVIAETAGATAPQTVTFDVSASLSPHALCVWRTTRDAEFTQQPNVAPVGGKVTLTLEPNAIYSLSTTTGQQKGAFADVPADRPFPLPYHDDFEGYGDGKAFGYLPAYTADICGVFEVAERPDHQGHCLKQVVSHKAQSWAPEWMPYTILGDANWTDYSVTASLNVDEGWAGLMGRVNHTGNGWDGNPDGYYARLYPDGGCALYVAGSQFKGSRDKQLAVGEVKPWKWHVWHTTTLRFQGRTISLIVDGKVAITVNDSTYDHGLAGLVTGGEGNGRNTALFDDLTLSPAAAEDHDVANTTAESITPHTPMYSK